ncbi:MAG: NYN domain-containing protein [Acidobacteriota bacterium]
MSPWWSRPTADGEKQSSSDDPPRGKGEEKPSQAGDVTQGAAEAHGDAEDPRERRRRSRTRRTRRRPADSDSVLPDDSRAAVDDLAPKADDSPPDAQEEADAPPNRPRRASNAVRRSRRRAEAAGTDTEPAERTEHKEDFTFDADVSPEDIEEIAREMFSSPPERSQSVTDERKIALFCDLENVALGVRDSDIKKFDIGLVLERLLEKGKIIVKKAYCDWERYGDYKRPFHEAAIEMIQIPQRHYSAKNSADIKMVVDAMDLSFSNEHLDTFVLLSGDSDFSPLVSKLRENNKYVIGIGVKNSSSNLLIDNCDEFIYYEDVWRDRQKTPTVSGGNDKSAEAFRLMIDSIQALIRENKDVLWGSMIKQTMQRKKPSFNEGYYSYGSFSELLEDAERQNLIKLKKDRRSGTYIVTGFANRR